MSALPRDIRSAVSDKEAEKLRELAQNKLVLELGAHYGFSTVVLAQAATRLHSVDWHKGDSMAGHGDFLLTYRDNLRRHGVEDKVVTHVGRFEEVLPVFGRNCFDGAFLDGEHDFRSVDRDIDLIWPTVKPGGWLAFHDYGRFEVDRAVDALCAYVQTDVEVFDYLAVMVKPPEPPGRWRQK